MKRKITKTMLFAFVICLFTALTVFSAGAATVTHKKLIYEVKGKTATLIESKSNAKKITVPAKVGKYKVTAIGDGAFSGKKKLTNITLPTSVTKIGKEAFSECTALKKVVLPASVKKISAGAFRYCETLESIVIPKSVKTLGKNIFEGCEGVTAYTVKGSKGEKYIKKQKNVTLAYRYMTSLKLSVGKLSLSEGDTATLSVKKKPQKLYNGKVTFSSDAPDIVSVNAKGVITAKKAGKATVTCTAKDGSKKTAVCTVTVTAKKAPAVQNPVTPVIKEPVTENVQTTVPAPKGPVKITQLKAENITCTGYTLVWESSELNNGYIISRYNSVNDKWIDIFDIAENSFTVSGLSPASAENYRVTAYAFENGKKVYAEPSEVITAKTATVSDVKQLSVSDTTDTTVTLMWDKAENANGYKVYLYDGKADEYTYLYTVSENEFTVSGLSSATEYSFAVRACYSDGYVNYDSNAYSDTATAKTLPGRVEKITASHDSIYTDRLVLSWDAVEGADGYNLYLYSKEKGEYELCTATEKTEATVSALEADTDYFFKIKAYVVSDGKISEGAFSDDFMFTTTYIPDSSVKAAQAFVDALYNMQSETASFDLSRIFTVTDMTGDSDEIAEITSVVRAPSAEYFTVSEGTDTESGAVAAEIIWPFDGVSDLDITDIDNGTLSFTEDGFGYNLRFTLGSDKAAELVCPTDFDVIEEENSDFVLLSYDYGDGNVQAKVIGSSLSMMKITVPVTAVFVLGGEKYEISYSLSQLYLF